MDVQCFSKLNSGNRTISLIFKDLQEAETSLEAISLAENGETGHQVLTKAFSFASTAAKIST